MLIFPIFAQMRRIIFVCHGNICRSPMAEWIFKDMAGKVGLGREFEVSSAAVSYEEQGNPMYTPAARKLREKGIPFGEHHAHRITAAEYAKSDIVVLMDGSNRRLLERIVPESRFDGKVQDMLEGREVADPWYTGDFEKAYRDIAEGCRRLLEKQPISTPHSGKA